MRVYLFVPCFIDQLFPNVAVSAFKVLRHLGCEVIYPENQTCCGQPAFNSGYTDEARLMAIHEVNSLVGRFTTSTETDFDFSRDYVVGLSGSCVAMIRNFYSELLSEETVHCELVNKLIPRVFELSEFVTKIIGVEKFSGNLSTTVSFHDSCHGLRELKIKNEPREILKRIDGLKLIELPFNEVCCGFGGTFSVKFPEISVSMADEKLKNFGDTRAETLVSCDSSCLMHLQGRAKRNGSSKRFAHLAEIMAESIGE